VSACPKSQEFELKSCYKSLVSVHFYGCMLSSSIETKHLVEFKQALYYLEIFDIEGTEWKIDEGNVLRRKGKTGTFNTVVSYGELGHIDDWFLERVQVKTGDWSPSLSTLKSVYSKRRKPLASLYSIGHRIRNRIFARTGGPKLAKRRKLTSVNPWTRYIISYLEKRRVSRIRNSTRFNPSDSDVESILLVSATFIQTRKRQAQESCGQGPDNQRL